MLYITGDTHNSVDMANISAKNIEEKRILVLGGARCEDKAYRIPHKS